ncbi:hypothetical protein CB0940_02979 [Cercospora beticola]|uniref:Uncharacterized protein n=1 Tax=Cercospora beticola TaxID=122368 RepID=A0A2G5I2Z8_CERBT|nr:hypothetical protein CB0940_02979 [Cercospora beticola]PIA99169.1 hypothetical protein CB0940_02979 [Cercospora beticola]WPB00141.1 hypothetical protein RHO25_004760 [Cercospora beticola]CAK1361673.1 unnamed protein product [Cercospora beticola]
MNLKRLLLIFLTAVSPAASLKMKLWHGVPKKTNGTALLACIDEMHADWSGKGNTDHWNGDGWECGGATWQFSQKFTRGRLRATAVIAKCTDELMKSAERGEAWVKCKVTRTLAQAWLGWSPKGFKMCDNTGGAPCQLDDGVLLSADGGAACRAEGYCYGGPEAPKEASVSTQTVERTVTVPGGNVDQPSPTGEPASEGAGPISSPGEPDAPTASTTTTQAESFTSVISLPVVVGPGPPTTSTSKPTTPPQPSYPSPSIDATPPPPSSSASPPPTPPSPPSATPNLTTSSSASSAPTETVIFITMTSGQSPTFSPPTAPPTFLPSTTRRPIMSTTIDGTLYTYLKEVTTTIKPPIPITTTIDKQVLTLIPATTQSTPHTSASWGRHKTWSRTG